MQLNKKWLINIKSTIGLNLVLAVLGVIGIISYIDFLNFRKSTYWREHTHKVIETNKELLNLITDAETGQRGYILAGEEVYLDPYRIAAPKINNKFKELRQLTLDNINQQRRLNQLEPLMRAKLAEIKQTTELRQNNKLTTALQIIKTNLGQQQMEEIRHLNSEIETEENQLLQKRLQHEEASFKVTKFVITFSSITAFGLVIIAFVLVNQELIKRRQSEAEQQRLLAQLEAERSHLEAVIQNMPGGVVIAEAPSGKLILGNKQVEQIWRHPFLPSRDIDEYSHWQGFHLINGQPYQTYEWPLARSISQGEVVTNEEINIQRGDRTSAIVSFSSAPIRDYSGSIVAGVITFQDISDRKHAEEQIKASLREKEVLLKEVHHRVKNNLQVIDSLFKHQCRRTKDPQTLEILKECQNRVSSIALIHEKLYNSPDLSKINFSEYIRTLVANLFDSYSLSISPSLIIKISNIFLTIETALPCGLIINELVSNSLKYAFSENQQGEIAIALEETDSDFYLIVKDNGRGLPENFNWQNSKSLGLKIVKSLVTQIDGNIEINNSKGAEFIIKFPKLQNHNIAYS